MIITNAAGRGWAWSGLVFGAGLSLLGNIAHTCLADTDISLGLRLPVAIAWPIALLVSIEILVRVNWRRAWLDNAGKFVLWAPVGAVAAVVSYRHMHSLLVMSGEDPFSALVGPLAVDGLMIGSTIALLAIRAHLQENSSPERSGELPEQDTETEEDPMDAELEKWLTPVANRIEPKPSEYVAPSIRLDAGFLQDTPVSPAPETSPVENTSGGRAGWERIDRELEEIQEQAEQPEKSAPVRRPRGEPSPGQARAAELIADNYLRGAVLDATEISGATYGRLAKVWRTLRKNPHSEIDPAAEKVHPKLIDVMRERARAQATR